MEWLQAVIDGLYLDTLTVGVLTTLKLALLSLLTGAAMAAVFTLILELKVFLLEWLVRGFILFFTGTPLLVQFFLIYSGPGQFDWLRESWLWEYLSQPFFCAVLALAMNTAAYSALLFKGALEAVPSSDWLACKALGMNTRQTLSVVVSRALRQVLPAYSNEVIMVLKGTSLASTITIMDLMGYAQRINAQTYDTLTVFTVAGAYYLVITALLTLGFRLLERRALRFQSVS
ncbi:amino acid ABC transporter membrane protein 2 (PAAT family) [Sinobacterium caligoides]|uniref:Arginine ABC transporter permease protein ArtM n=1 Tax=Sinobacterium caligoides TaxID=933926 RepID=A0A3N2DFW7_9GAMM|nr:arginine ABC transporter permease ArtM [Sinobacterium caligoides]ROR98705.1 amino acid ABC transporter membrane protein 2 (PAAT family) [Sinobacterium caligoides]